MEITEALPTANKKRESLSANQKRNQRRAKHKSKENHKTNQWKREANTAQQNTCLINELIGKVYTLIVVVCQNGRSISDRSLTDLEELLKKTTI